MVLGATSLVTTLPAPMTAPSPTVMPQRMVALEPMEAPFLITVGMTCQSASVWIRRLALVDRGVAIVDEHDAVADKDLVFDGHALADEGVALDLAVFADEGVFLDLDKGADLGVRRRSCSRRG